MGAPKKETFPIQLMSLKAIKVDHDLQSRARMSLEDQRDFSEAMLRGDQFPPVTLFYDGKKYWLADGFHRHAAAVKARLDSIRAEIRIGTTRDAAVFSAGANQKFSIKRNNEDIKKALYMLFRDKEWSTMSAALIAKHVGVNFVTVQRHRSGFYECEGGERPAVIVFEQDGKKRTICRDFVLENAKTGVNAKREIYGLPRQPTTRNPAFNSMLPPTSKLHSDLDRAEAIAEARRIGESTPGNGWRRLLWRLADLLENDTASPKGNQPDA